MVSGKLDFRFKPEFCLSFSRMHVNMDTRLLAGKEKEAVTCFPKNGGAHGGAVLVYVDRYASGQSQSCRIGTSGISAGGMA